MIVTFPKGRTRKQIKSRAKRQAAKIVRSVRAQVVKRDGHCRMAKQFSALCTWRSEWAHLGDQKRARTRGMVPTLRHTTAGSLMACTYHHRLYDSGQMEIRLLTADGADGPLEFACEDWVKRERGPVAASPVTEPA